MHLLRVRCGSLSFSLSPLLLFWTTQLCFPNRCGVPFPRTHTHTPQPSQNSGPSRISQPTDLLRALLVPFLPAAKVYPKTHPYFVNYEGVKNLAAAAKEAGVPKFIRVSGLSGTIFRDGRTEQTVGAAASASSVP